MGKYSLRRGINNGLVFGIIVAFLILIGFHSTIAQLFDQAFPPPPGMNLAGLPPLHFYWLTFLAIVGVWAGITTARRGISQSNSSAMLGALTTGALFGAIIGILAYLIGISVAKNINLSTYLAQMIPDNTNVFLLEKTPPEIALYYLVFLIVVSLLGGSVTVGWNLQGTKKFRAATWGKLHESVSGNKVVRAIRENNRSRYTFYGIILLIAFALPLVIGQYWNYTVGTIGIYVLLGLGLNVVVGMAGLLDLGYVAFFAIGAYTMALLTAPAPQHLTWSFWVALPIGIVLAATAGILLGIPVLRMRGDYLAIVTLGFGEIIRILLNSDLLSNFTGGPRGVPDVAGPTILGLPFSSDIDFVYLILLAVILVIFVTSRLKNSRIGRAWISMREDETVAQAMGINTWKYKLMAFAIGAAFAGLGGAVFASRNQFTGPGDHTLMVSINVLALVIVGGMGSLPGVIAGAFVLKGLPEFLRELDNYRVLIFGALLVLMMIVRPEGLIPSRVQSLELAEKSEAEHPQAQPDTVPSTQTTPAEEQR